jgi:hypothetical protein
MLDGTGKQLLGLLKRLDDTATTYESLVADARQEVVDAQASLESLLTLEGLCDATTLKTPTGRKRRRDRGKKRAGKNGGESAVPEVSEIAEAAGEGT